MADLSVNVDEQPRRIRDILAGAAIGVALVAAGLYEAPLRLTDTVSAAMDPPSELSAYVHHEKVRVLDWITGVTRFTASQNARSSGMMEPPFKMADAVTVSLGLSTTNSEPVRAGTSGQVELIGLGNPVRVVDGPPIAQLTSGGSSVSTAESFKVADVLITAIDPELATGQESLKVADSGLTAVLEQAINTVLAEQLKVADAPAVLLNPERATPSESVKIGVSWRVDLYGLGNPIKVTDGPPIAALVSGIQTTATENLKIGEVLITDLAGDIFATPAESLKIADSPALTINPEQAIPSDTVKVSDTLQVSFDYAVALAESLKIVDAVTGPIINPEIVLQSESLKVADSLSAAIQVSGLSAALSEALKISEDGEFEFVRDETLKITDSVSASLTASNLAANLAESCKVVDTIVGRTLNPLICAPSESVRVLDVLVVVPPLTTSISESLKVADAGEVELIRDETIRVIDTLTVALAGNLSATPSESVKVSDSLIAAKDLLQAGLTETFKLDDEGTVELVQFEGLSVVDTLTVVREANDRSVVVTPEVIKVADGGTVELVQFESLAVSDALTVSLGVSGGLDVVISPEALKIADSLARALTPEQASPAESLKIADQITVLLGAGVGQIESVKVSDSPSLLLNPEQATPTEICKVSDAVFASLGGATVLAEALEIADLPELTLDPEQAVTSESAKVTDSPSAILDLVASLSESVKVSDALTAVRQQAGSAADENLLITDTVSAQLTVLALQVAENVRIEEFGPAITVGTTVSIIQTESLEISEALSLALDPEETTQSEATKISDTVFASLTVEQAEVVEALGIADSLSASLDKLNVSLSEGVKVGDSPSIGGPEVIDSIGYYVTVIDIVGEFI